MSNKADDVRGITVLAYWFGFASPSHRCNRLDVRRISTDVFESVDAMNQTSINVDASNIEDFLLAVANRSDRPLPDQFGQSQEILDKHFGSIWTDDNPSIRIVVDYKDNKRLELCSDSCYAHLLPWWIIFSSDSEAKSFNPKISTCLARMMPEGFLFRERLLDSTVAFELLKRWGDELKAEASTSTSLDNEWKGLVGSSESSDELFSPNTNRTYSPSKLGRMSEQELLEIKATGYDLSSAGQAALMDAASRPFDSEKFWKLVRVGVNVDARRTDGLTGLMLACSGGDQEAVHQWLIAGADLHVRDSGGRTALMFGARNESIVEALLTRGAWGSQQDNDGDTALDYSLENLNIMFAQKRLNAVKLLADELARSSPDLLHRSHKRALDLARKTRLEVEILHAMERQPMSGTLSDLKDCEADSESVRAHLVEFTQLIDLEITEIELADRIVDIIGKAIQSRS